MDKTELIMRRKNVRAFIDADPVYITIIRPGDPVKNPNTGGYLPVVATPLPPQKARIVQNVRRYTAGLVNAEAGDIPDSEYRLIGNYTLDLEANDTFTWLGEHYTVLGIHTARQESVFAAITLRGPENRG